ncbi:hypothetical protein B0H14DRAFT_3088949 [Mycena olivaceomarginata]|nr:hypothetical protein B0H14DRAFT_3088949 [Mycena olivaceomarginata]
MFLVGKAPSKLFALKPALRTIDLSKASQPSDAKVVVVPLPKNTIGITFGQRTAAWLQRTNTYLLDTNYLVIDPQAVWDAPEETADSILPQSSPYVGPYTEDRYIGVYLSHKAPSDTDYVSSDPKRLRTYHEFQIGGQNAIRFTMVNAEDGGDTDYHDAVVGVAVVS